MSGHTPDSYCQINTPTTVAPSRVVHVDLSEQIEMSSSIFKIDSFAPGRDIRFGSLRFVANATGDLVPATEGHIFQFGI